jgi:2Fe-2S ferredoxin
VVRSRTTQGGADVELDAPRGGPLVDLCDASQVEIPFSCRSASCGTCRVTVLEGASLLAPPEVDERELLAIFATPAELAGVMLGDSGAPVLRLACQARIRPGPGLIILRAAPDDDDEPQ